MSVCEWTTFPLSPDPFQYIGRRSTLGHSANFASTLGRWDIAEEMDTFRFLAFYTNGGNMMAMIIQMILFKGLRQPQCHF